jgi:hypothetical protein
VTQDGLRIRFVRLETSNVEVIDMSLRKTVESILYREDQLQQQATRQQSNSDRSFFIFDAYFVNYLFRFVAELYLR